ncbi:MAG: prepilin-type N-terminal cleavage/methylation domain-containing protein [Candidatus Zipacnadales bacterium]
MPHKRYTAKKVNSVRAVNSLVANIRIRDTGGEKREWLSSRRSVWVGSEVLRQRTGFTLLELLVVIAIIVLLAGILLPTFARAQAKARQSTCLSNLAQIGKAFLMYAADYDDGLPIEWYPNGGGFRQDLQPYLASSQVFFCPSQPGETTSSYGMPAWTAWMSYWEGSARLAAATSPGDSLLLAEQWSSWFSARDPVHWPSPWWPELGNIAWSRHDGGANYLLVDGHCKWLRRTQTYAPVCMWWVWPHPPSGECGGRPG